MTDTVAPPPQAEPAAPVGPSLADLYAEKARRTAQDDPALSALYTEKAKRVGGVAGALGPDVDPMQAKWQSMSPGARETLRSQAMEAGQTPKEYIEASRGLEEPYQTPEGLTEGGPGPGPGFVDRLGQMVAPLAPASTGSLMDNPYWQARRQRIQERGGGVEAAIPEALGGVKDVGMALLSPVAGASKLGAGLMIGSLADAPGVNKTLEYTLGLLGKGAKAATKALGGGEVAQETAQEAGDITTLVGGAKAYEVMGKRYQARKGVLESAALERGKAASKAKTEAAAREGAYNQPYGTETQVSPKTAKPSKLPLRGTPVDIEAQAAETRAAEATKNYNQPYGAGENVVPGGKIPLTGKPVDIEAQAAVAREAQTYNQPYGAGENIAPGGKLPRTGTPVDIEVKTPEPYGQELPSNSGGPGKLPLTGKPLVDVEVQQQPYTGDIVRENAPGKLPLTGEAPTPEPTLETHPELFDDQGLRRTQITRPRQGGSLRRGGSQEGSFNLPDIGVLGEKWADLTTSEKHLADLEALGVSEGAGGVGGPPEGAKPASGAPGSFAGVPGGTTGPGGSKALKFDVGQKSILNTLTDEFGAPGKELSQMVRGGETKAATTAADWQGTWDQGWNKLSSAAKKALRTQGTAAVEDPSLPLPPGAREFIENERAAAKTKANEELLVEEGGKLRASHIDPASHVNHVLTDEAIKRYKANDPATIQAWEQANPGRSYEDFIKSKISEVPGRYESDWLKPTNRNALPREVNWPQGDLEQNIENLDRSYNKRMASHQAQMEHLGISNTDLGQYTGPKGQGRYGELLAEIKAGHGQEAAAHVEDMVKNAFGRGDRGNATTGGRLGNKMVKFINGSRAVYFFTGNMNALHHVIQGGLTTAETMRHPSTLVGMMSEFLQKGPRGVYKEGVSRGGIPKMFRDVPAMEGMKWSEKASGIGNRLNQVATATYSGVSTAMRTFAYAASEAEMKALTKDLVKGGSKEAGALHILDDEMNFYPHEIDEIRSGDVSDATLKKFQRVYTAKATGSAIGGEEANWTHSPNYIAQLASFAQRGALATTNMTLRGPIEEAFNGRPQRLATVLATAYVVSPMIQKGWEGVFGKDKNAPRNLDEIIGDIDSGKANAKLEVADWLADATVKSWALGGVGRRLSQAAHTAFYGAEHNQKLSYIVAKAVGALIDPVGSTVPSAQPALLTQYKKLKKTLPDVELIGK